MNPGRTISLVARRDFEERLRSKAFLISTAFTLVILVGIIVAGSIFGGEDDPVPIGFVGTPDSGVVEGVEATLDRAVTIERFNSDTAGADALEAGTIDALVESSKAVVVGENTGGQLELALVSAIGRAKTLAAAEELGIDPGTLTALFTSGNVEVRQLDPPDPDEQRNQTLAFFGAVLMFIALITYGQWITIGVIEEKSSRVVEVVLGAVPARSLLAGKIIGIGALGLLQLIIFAAVGLTVASFTSGFEIPSAAGRTTAAVIVWFLLGFAFYATAFAAAGSLVTRQEDAQNVVFPVSIFLIIGYMISTTALTGMNDVVRVASYIPLTAPTTMPMRIAVSDAAWWEVVAATGLMVLAIWVLVRVAARIYSGGLLRIGQRTKIREALRSAET